LDPAIEQTLSALRDSSQVLDCGPCFYWFRHGRWNAITPGQFGGLRGIGSIAFATEGWVAERLRGDSRMPVVTMESVADILPEELRHKVLAQAEDYAPLLEKGWCELTGGQSAEVIRQAMIAGNVSLEIRFTVSFYEITGVPNPVEPDWSQRVQVIRKTLDEDCRRVGYASRLMNPNLELLVGRHGNFYRVGLDDAGKPQVLQFRNRAMAWTSVAEATSIEPVPLEPSLDECLLASPVDYLPLLREGRLLLKGGPSSDMIGTANWSDQREAELLDSVAYLMENGASYSWLEFR